MNHDHKGFSEEKCVRCGWVMGMRPINCVNDDTPHVFPSQQPIDDESELESRLYEVERTLGSVQGQQEAIAGLERRMTEAERAPTALFMGQPLAQAITDLQGQVRLLHEMASRPAQSVPVEGVLDSTPNFFTEHVIQMANQYQQGWRDGVNWVMAWEDTGEFGAPGTMDLPEEERNRISWEQNIDRQVQSLQGWVERLEDRVTGHDAKVPGGFGDIIDPRISFDGGRVPTLKEMAAESVERLAREAYVDEFRSSGGHPNIIPQPAVHVQVISMDGEPPAEPTGWTTTESGEHIPDPPSDPGMAIDLGADAPPLPTHRPAGISASGTHRYMCNCGEGFATRDNRNLHIKSYALAPADEDGPFDDERPDEGYADENLLPGESYNSGNPVDRSKDF